MNEVIVWAEFVGGWLLVAGPLYQGSVELGDMDFDREVFEGIRASALQAAQDPPSAWWWLLPPVMYVLRRRWAKAYRAATVAQLTEAQHEQLASFRSKATGWFTVASGAALLAAGETWQVIKHYDWPVWLFWLLVAVMLAVSLLNTAVRRIGEEHTRRSAGAEAEAAPSAELS